MGRLSAEDRNLLAQSVAAFVRDTCDYETLRKTLASPAGRRPDWWRRLADELGILGLAQDEAVGGMGGGAADLSIVAEAFGRHLVNEPFLQAVAMAGELLRGGGEAADAALARLVQGEVIVVPALFERGSRYRAETIEARAERSGDGWRLSGRKCVVRGAAWADRLVVSAWTGKGVSLFLVDPAAEGVELIAYPTFDGQRAADVVLNAAAAEALVGIEGEALPVIARAMDVGVVVQAAEAVGVMRHLMEATVEHVRTRRQFGQPIGGFQTLQFRLADMAMALERADAVTRQALSALDASPERRARAASGAKLAVDAACDVVGEGAVQLHGAIGLTEELSVSHAFKRVAVIQVELGDAAYHQDRLVAAGA